MCGSSAPGCTAAQAARGPWVSSEVWGEASASRLWIDSIRSRAILAHFFCSSGTTISVVHLAVDQPLEHPEQMVRRHAEHRRAQAAHLIERNRPSSPAPPLRRDDGRDESRCRPPTSSRRGASRTVFRMYSVEPLSSAARSTSNGTSGCTITRTPGYCCAHRFDLFRGEAHVHRAVALPQNRACARSSSSCVRPPNGSNGSHTTISSSDTPIFHAVLRPRCWSGRNRIFSLCSHRPLQRGGGVRRGADRCRHARRRTTSSAAAELM